MNYQRLYEYRFRGVDQADREAVWETVAPYIHRALGSPARVLDPAAGRGEFINHCGAGERWAVDRVAYAEGTYQPDVRVIIDDIFTAPLPEAYFGGALVSNFLEHLPDQEACAGFLERMHGLIAPGGSIAIMGPNFRYAANEYYDMADHTLALTHRAVTEHLYAAGFEPRRVDPRFLPYSFTGRLPASPLLTRAYLRTPVAWRFLGKQFFVVADRDR